MYLLDVSVSDLEDDIVSDVTLVRLTVLLDLVIIIFYSQAGKLYKKNYREI